jgi:NAD(P)-dependent dehydrogenase (short-subunit alcohol dehydrogenase family)
MKTAIVTGGSRGIGFGIASKLADEGWNVVINGMRPKEGVSEAIETLRAKGVEVAYAQGDIGSVGGRSNILEVARKLAGGAVQLLVNNAGITSPGRMDILDTLEENFDLVMSTNLKGAFFLSQCVANDMVKAKASDDSFEGCIVNITSISSTVVSTNRPDYCIAKAGLSMMNQLFAARLGEYDIPVYEVRPGVIKSDMTAGVTDKYDKLIEDGLCVTKRWGYPEDVGKAVAALARRDFPYSTGQVIMVDGALTMPRL